MKVSLNTNNENTCQFVVAGWGGATIPCTGDKFLPVPAAYTIEANPVHCFTTRGAGIGHITEQVSHLCKKHAAIVASEVTGQKVGQRELKALAS